jgi:hypothetical protein
MIEYSGEPVLIALRQNGWQHMAMSVPVALDADSWEAGSIDDFTLLPSARKDDRFYAVFFWSDAEGREVERNEASHLAMQVDSRNASEKQCAREQLRLMNRLKCVASTD